MKFYIIALFLMCLPVFISGCSSAQAPGAIANLDEEFTLAPGQSISIEGADMQIKFLNVTGDSRCPTGAVCIWAGEVKCSVEITYQSKLYPLTLVAPGPTDAGGKQDFQGFQMSFSVDPYPELNKKISQADYRLHMTISRA